MIACGLDFSMTSPGLCVSDGRFLEFVSLFESEGKKKWDDSRKALKQFEGHRRIAEAVHLVPYTRQKTTGLDYVEAERVKLDNANHLTRTVMSYLPANADKIVLEGFSFNSRGASYLDLAVSNSFLRKALCERYGSERIVVLPPALVKKFATGKGNADKSKMIQAFVESGDPRATATSLHALLRDDEELRGLKPCDDLVDAYWLLRTAEAEGYLSE